MARKKNTALRYKKGPVLCTTDLPAMSWGEFLVCRSQNLELPKPKDKRRCE